MRHLFPNGNRVRKCWPKAFWIYLSTLPPILNTIGTQTTDLGLSPHHEEKALNLALTLCHTCKVKPGNLILEIIPKSSLEELKPLLLTVELGFQTTV